MRRFGKPISASDATTRPSTHRWSSSAKAGSTWSYEIVEGGRTKIARIDFNGNNAYSDRRLADVISTKRSSILSFLMRDDVYDENRLRADEEALRRFYYNRGYADFQVISATGDLDESKNEYVVSITVEEGERYTFGDIWHREHDRGC